MTGGLGETYTPTVIGSDGFVYAINDAVLFAIGGHHDEDDSGNAGLE